MAVRLLLIQALSSLHSGTGQGVGAIDLPIARERATELPLVPGSTIKGCIKDQYPGNDKDAVFGTDKIQGRVQVGDARLLLLPVRCLGATFVWTTSPYVLRRLKRDAEAAKCALGMPVIREVAEGNAIVVAEDSLIELGEKEKKRKLVLEDFDFDASVASSDGWAQWIAGKLYPGDAEWQREFLKRFAIIDDRSFQFLVRHATEVQAHVEIDKEKGTVKQGALWYQESLPAESVLVSIVRGGEKPEEVEAVESVANVKYLQMGGKATTGQGLVRVVVVGGTS